VTGSRVAVVLAELTAGDDHPEDWPAALTERCRRQTGTDGACLALVTSTPGGGLQSGGVVAATDPLAAQLEEVQFAVGAGPCLEALRTGRPVSSPDLRAPSEDRWQAFAAEMSARGVRAVFAFPLVVGAIQIGVLELHRETTGPLSVAEHAEGRVFADAATAVLLHLQDRSASGRDPGPPLAALVDGQAVVHQASGMVAAQLGTGLGAALARLRAHAWAEHLPLSAVSASVVDRGIRFDDSRAGVAPGRPLRDGGTGS
jgi:GAF domain-containing protein